MRNRPLHTILLLLTVLLLASCYSDTVLREVQFPPETLVRQRAISFDMHPHNITKAVTAMSKTPHYEFGVFASLKDSYGAPEALDVMSNYLVAYGPHDAYKPWYKPTAEDAMTGNTAWIYSTLGCEDPYAPVNQDMAHLTKSDVPQQIDKYWDENAGNYYFYAYTPYQWRGIAASPGTIGISSQQDGETLTFNGLRAFYTHAVNGGQPHNAVTSYQTGITRGRHTAQGYQPNDDILVNDDELINANEALYAGTTVDPKSYSANVPIIFKHVNAKVRIAFWEDIKGYDVEILDVIPEGTGLTATKGVALTPASLAQTAYPAGQTPKAELAPYYAQAQVTVDGISPESLDTRTNFTDIHVGNTQTDAVSHENLWFCIPDTNIIGSTRETMTFSPTTYYPLPNYESTLSQPGYITSEADGLQVASQTGFTAHVTFRLHPVDGAYSQTVYDARAYVPADKCRWEAGKQYIYVFRITTKATGTTDPDKPDPTDPDTPWVDPDDPRIPDDPALNPLIFDDVKVEDYESADAIPDYKL